tara:strand:- start:1212 stop:1862 length:651 start_codon:yes stop_codon:yes gene_type:complete
MLIGITVSTNYDDILKISLEENLKFFDHWYIITNAEDLKTIDLIKNINKITILYFDFKEGGVAFNKGGAIKYAQNIIHKKYNKCLILILDTDIILPCYFKHIIEKESFEINKLYGSMLRLDFASLNNYKTKVGFSVYGNSLKYCGYFQMYYVDKENPDCNFYTYEPSYHCGLCDDSFRANFNIGQILEITVYHLGKSNSHWLGRTVINDFLFDIKE